VHARSAHTDLIVGAPHVGAQPRLEAEAQGTL
jgi:hypothetical protein